MLDSVVKHCMVIVLICAQWIRITTLLLSWPACIRHETKPSNVANAYESVSTLGNPQLRVRVPVTHPNIASRNRQLRNTPHGPATDLPGSKVRTHGDPIKKLRGFLFPTAEVVSSRSKSMASDLRSLQGATSFCFHAGVATHCSGSCAISCEIRPMVNTSSHQPDKFR